MEERQSRASAALKKAIAARIQESNRKAVLDAWLNKLDRLPLECDGLTRVIHTLLERDSIAHKVCIGTVDASVGSYRGSIPYHLWIELEDGRIIDLRARMWLGENAPHGIFDKPSYPVYTEMSATTDYPCLRNGLFLMMTDAIPEEFAPFPMWY